VSAIRELAGKVKSLLILEEGYPLIERYLQGLLPGPVEVWGKESGHVQPDGEMTPDSVRWALGLPEEARLAGSPTARAARPPRLCQGCPHCDAYAAVNRALAGFERPLVTSDIGCYTLGVLPPYGVGESCVCMGASIGMAKGAAEGGHYPVVAIIGDSTFLHSGVTPLIDAVTADADMTVVILDNQVVAMTGSQPTVLPSSKLAGVVLGVGVDPDHFRVLDAHPKRIDEMTDVMRAEIEHRGLSVVIAHRECVVSARKRKRGTR
jgi:indolepyruvate ferredoxin oxidoreductase alpha subunit